MSETSRNNMEKSVSNIKASYETVPQQTKLNSRKLPML